MKRTYERWLVARGNVFAPSSAAVVKLIEQLRAEHWIIDPAAPELARLHFAGPRGTHARTTGGYALRTVENAFGDDGEKKLAANVEALALAIDKDWLDAPEREELRLVWPVESDEPLPATVLRSPLARSADATFSYAFEIDRCPEFVYPTADGIGELPTTCHCTEDLAFAWDDEELVPAFERATGIFTECEQCSRTFDPSKGSAEITDPLSGKTETFAGGAAHRFALKVTCGADFDWKTSVAFDPELVALLEKEFGRSFYEIGAAY